MCNGYGTLGRMCMFGTAADIDSHVEKQEFLKVHPRVEGDARTKAEIEFMRQYRLVVEPLSYWLAVVSL